MISKNSTVWSILVYLFALFHIHLGSSFIQYHIYASALFISPKLREKRPNTKLFLVRIFLYSDWILENTNKKYLRIWTLFTQC